MLCRLAQAHTWWAVEVDAQPHASLVVSIFRSGPVGDPGVQLNAGRTRGAAEYRLPQGQYMVRTRPHTWQLQASARALGPVICML